ncbi:ABC transporter permease [Nocardia goodfellowii]|uniref:ABC transport system permease protein n=1 Tax=Nocardia goodfellowii TaxID=882446 RepID=A0ABS4QE34_9NOCA|nr:FtsX-like permease family protein [Nocardia goodfellowii]MBP2189927.1 putative ABC transport system permease protein [Nocardia goodfellowii]
MGANWDRLRLFNIGELLAHRGRTVMSLAVMSISAALLVAVLSISGSVTGSVDKLTRALGGSAVLEVSGITDAGFEQQLLPQISATPGVRTAVPMLRAQMGAGDDRLMLIGADTSSAALGSRLTGAMSGQARKLLSVRNGVLVGAALGRQEGDTFRLGTETVTVAGVLDRASSEQLNGGHIVATQLGLAQKLIGRPGRLDSVQIIAEPGTDIAALRGALTEAVGGRAVVADPSLRTAQAGGAIQIVRYSTLMSAFAALIVSAFLIYNAMSMAVAQRRPMLSLLRAIGGKRGPMVRDLLAEAGLLGLLGGAIGAGIGILMGRVSIDRLPVGIVQSVEARTEYLVPWYAIPAAVVACVLASVIAAAIAARQVYKVEPIEALVPVGVAHTDTTSRALRIAAIVLGLGLAGGAIVIANADLGRMSLVAISMSYAAAVVLCFAATGLIVRATAAIARRFGPPGALGATTLERAPRRVWATAMTVMIGVAATVAMGGASRNMVDSAGKTFEELSHIDLNVSLTPAEQFPTGPLLPADIKDKAAQVPGVAGVSPAQMAFATLGSGRVMLQGFETEKGAVRIAAVDKTLLPRLASGEGVIISRDVARELGVAAGSQVTLPTPTGAHTARVLQVIPYFSAVAGAVIMDIDHMRAWYERPGETILAVDIAEGADPAAVQAGLRAALPPDIRIATGQQQVEAISGSLRQGTALSAAILWIVVLVATVALLNTLMLSVLERRRELGVLRAMGTNRKFLLRSVLAEAAGIGFVGAAIGLVVGAGIQYLALIAIGQAMTIDPIYDPSLRILVYGAVALGLALLGSIPPALRAARLPIVAALAVD